MPAVLHAVGDDSEVMFNHESVGNVSGGATLLMSDLSVVKKKKKRKKKQRFDYMRNVIL